MKHRNHGSFLVVVALFVAYSCSAAAFPVTKSSPRRPIMTVPPRVARLPWEKQPPRSPRELPVRKGRIESRTQTSYRGANACASSVSLASDFDVERGYFVVGAITNDGSMPLSDVTVRYHIGHPDSGGQQIGQNSMIPLVPTGVTVFDSISWIGFTGGSRLYMQVDPANTIQEDNEQDNECRLAVVLRDDVSWVWQVVNGYCNYAGLTMLFNFSGANQTVYETVELANCPHSAVYADDHFYLPGGIMISQTTSDYEFAGDIRNMSMDMTVESDWLAYQCALQQCIDSGIPFVTSVDPYYLPQADYELLPVYGIHSGHAVVVTGYTDSSVVFNDPGVGLPLLGDPIPEPEKRGADVVVEWQTFRLAVESTLGTPRLLISYTSLGPLPSTNEMLTNAIEKSMNRLEGEDTAYDPAWLTTWPSGWDPVFGISAYATAADDMNLQTFESVFQELLDATGGDLNVTLQTLAQFFADGMFWTQIGWEASEEYYGTFGSENADRIAVLSGDLAQVADRIYWSFVDLLTAVGNSGGNTAVAAPYLSEIAADLEEIVLAEEDMLPALEEFLATGAEKQPTIHRLDGVQLLCMPNPFPASILIRFSSPNAGVVSIYDLNGRRIRTLSGISGQGQWITTRWDGKNAADQPMPAGTYVIRAKGAESVRIVKTR